MGEVRALRLSKVHGTMTRLSVETDYRSFTIFLTEEQLQHVSNRMQSFAKGGEGYETVAIEIEL